MMSSNNKFDIILKYFPELSDKQKEQMEALYELYQDWNAKINVISRKDIDLLYERHVLHSLAIAKFIQFEQGARILDVGTGGGFPGIPLAIFYPECQFTLIDSIGKKIRVATDVAQQIKLENITLKHENGKDEKGQFDFVVSRAVMQAPELINLIRHNVSKKQNHKIANGLICLKGGDLDEEVSDIKTYYKIQNLSDYFEEEFFETKKILYVAMK